MSDSAEEQGSMTIRTYRITSTGQRTEPSAQRSLPSRPYGPAVSGTWPPCRCARCTGDGPAAEQQPGR